MTQLRPDDVRRVAEAAGLHEIYFNQTSCVISFAPDEDDLIVACRKRREDEGRREAEQQRERRADELRQSTTWARWTLQKV